MADLATCLGDSGKRVLDGLVGSAEALGAVRWPRAAAAYKGLAEPSPQGDCAVTAIAGSRTGGEHPEMPSSAIAVDWRVGVLWLFEPLASAPPRWRATAALIHGAEMIRSIRVSKEWGGSPARSICCQSPIPRAVRRCLGSRCPAWPRTSPICTRAAFRTHGGAAATCGLSGLRPPASPGTLVAPATAQPTGPISCAARAQARAAGARFPTPTMIVSQCS